MNFLKKPPILSRSFGASLVIATALGASASYAADPCPWQDTDNAAACAQWDIMASRLEAAEARANAAEEALNAMEGALKSMEDALQSMQTGATTEQSQQQISSGSEQAAPAGGAPDSGMTDAETADASTADPKEQQARAFIDKLLGYLTMQSLGMEVEGGFIINQDYALVQDGNTYTTTFDEAAFAVEELRIDFGPLVFSVEPVDEDTSNVSMRLGDTISGREGGQELFTLSIGAQELAGVWSARAQSFLDGKTKLQDLKLTVAEEDFNADVGSVELLQTLSLNDDGVWSQQQTMAISGTLISGDGNSVSLDDVNGQMTVNGQDYFKLINATTEIQKLVETSMDADEPPAELFDYLGQIFNSFDGYSVDLNAQNLDIAQQGMPIAKIAHLGFGSSWVGAEEDTSRLTYKMELDGFDTQMAPLPPNILPRQTRIEMALSNIPGQLVDRFIEVGMASEALGEDEKDDFFQQQLMGLLMSSALQFDIIDSFIAAEAARLDVNAHAEVNQQSMMGGTGNLSIKIENMQTIIDTTGAAQQQSIAPVLAMITAFSDRTEQDGKTIDTFNLEFTAEGKLMLNGKDITGMIMPGASPQ